MKITLDDIPFETGKYIGLTAREIAQKDPDYIVYTYYTTKTAPISRTLLKSCLGAKVVADF